MKIYEVGGSIRDSFLNAARGGNDFLLSKDRDFTVMASSYEEMRDYLLKNGAEFFLETPQYFTIRCRYQGIKSADFVLARKEGDYSDGRHPDTVEIADTIEEELARRDFTMNAIAKDLDTGLIIDPFEGVQDINEGHIVCVGETKDRFEEDSLRMLRAIRFAITKNLSISTEIRVFLSKSENIDLLKSISIERIREEMLKCFKCNTSKTLNFLNYYDDLRNYLFKDNGLGLWLKPTLERI